MNEIASIDVPHFERKLRARMEQLRQEIEATRARERSERYEHVAGEAHDAADASVASVTVDTNIAEVRRDELELREIAEALDRIAAGRYGICLRCGEPIEIERLEAPPTAKRHLVCQEAHDHEFGLAHTPKL